MSDDHLPLIVSTAVLAALLSVTPRRVQQLHKEGVFPSAGHGRWDAMQCVPAASRYRLENEMARVQKDPAETRVREARAREIELRIAKERRDLIPTEESFAILDEICGIYRSSFSGMAARVTRDLVLRRKIDAEIDATQHRVCDVLAKRAAEIREDIVDAA